MFGLKEGVAALGGETIAELPDSVLGGDIVELSLLMDRLEGERARRVALFRERRGFLEDGAFSIVAWLRWKCRMRTSRAQALEEMATRLVELPATASALVGGEISIDHARVITACSAAVGTDAMATGEPILLEAARELDPCMLSIAAAHFRHAVDPEGALLDANKAYESRKVWLSKLGNMYRLDGQLDAEGGAYLQTALNALMGVPQAGDNRSAAQRRADALVELARRKLNSGELSQFGGQKPHLSLLVRAETLRGEPGAEAADFEWGGAVPGETALRLACDCALTEVAIDHDGNPLDVGRTRRSVQPSQKRALVVRDRHCRFTGCDAPVEWTDAHHLRHWIHGGPTLLWNLVLLCGRHHRLVHEGGWKLEPDARGELVAVPPWPRSA
ncbi:MAG: HNH endonuclease [Candidatus Dormibacteraeota bacterium]|nr:HNH endonuclease [Candidatus Dormibacteraeota bacterium]